MRSELLDLLRWLVTGRSLPEQYYVHAVELEELRADLAGFVRSGAIGLAIVAAAIVTGYVLGSLR